MMVDIVLERHYTVFELCGVVTLAFAGLTSFLAVLLVLIKSVIPGSGSLTRTYRQTNFLGYFLSLLVSNMIESIGTMMDVKWIAQGGLEEGAYCRIQGGVKQFGNVGNAIWSLMISIHLFNLLFRRSASTLAGLLITLFAGWGFILAMIVIGPAAIQTKERGSYYGVSGNWCWITSEYKLEQLYLEYFLEFFSAGISFVIYTLVLLRVQGNLVITWHRAEPTEPNIQATTAPGPDIGSMHASSRTESDADKKPSLGFSRKLSSSFGSMSALSTRLHGRSSSRTLSSGSSRGRPRVAWRFVPRGQGWKLSFRRDYLDASMLRVVQHMVWYPVAYTILIVPVGAARLSAVAGISVPEAVTFLTAILFNLTGLVNVLLLVMTHRKFPETTSLPRFDTARPTTLTSKSKSKSGSTITSLNDHTFHNSGTSSGSGLSDQSVPNKYGITPFLLYDYDVEPPTPTPRSPFNTTALSSTLHYGTPVTPAPAYSPTLQEGHLMGTNISNAEVQYPEAVARATE
ncbi:hypothetical protein BT96DRAFT_981211 [Gymnopus androsaceus JB14]|uniref:Uncharacterized protein n=1 Tax=Gymnopus androsaceus JB14 TaxID=1447944 RepID=A0A6A4GRI0_9AGAR|nr:hypothetical protein BT96DRAFT_981211 [Gymnopus androsaceus JB14]